VLGDLLNLNFVVGERVEGMVTVQTTSPVSKAAMVDFFETVLRSRGAVIVEDAGFYRIVPGSDARAGIPIAEMAEARPGLGVQVVPLAYTSAEEVRAILEPIAPAGGILRVDSARNLLVLTGTGAELAAMREAVSLFDVDWMKGMSFALHPLESTAPEVFGPHPRRRALQPRPEGERRAGRAGLPQPRPVRPIAEAHPAGDGEEPVQPVPAERARAVRQRVAVGVIAVGAAAGGERRMRPRLAGRRIGVGAEPVGPGDAAGDVEVPALAELRIVEVLRLLQPVEVVVVVGPALPGNGGGDGADAAEVVMQVVEPLQRAGRIGVGDARQPAPARIVDEGGGDAVR